MRRLRKRSERIIRLYNEKEEFNIILYLGKRFITDIMKDWGLLKYYSRMLVTRLRREMKNSVIVGLIDLRNEQLITVERERWWLPCLDVKMTFPNWQTIEDFLKFLWLEVDEGDRMRGRTKNRDRTREIGYGRENGFHKNTDSFQPRITNHS